MKVIFVLSVAAIAGTLISIIPASAADLPDTRPAYGYTPVPTARTYIAVPGCRLGVERFWDGYAWRSRSIQVCN